MGDVRLLDVTLLTSNRESNQLAVAPNQEGTQAFITFIHLDKGNGGGFQIIHTGNFEGSVQLAGDLIGVDRLRLRDIQTLTRGRRQNRLSVAAAFLFSITLFAWIWLGLPVPWTRPKPEDEISDWGYMFLICLYLVGVGHLMWPLYRARLPRGLEAFHDDPFEFRGPKQSREQTTWVRRWLHR